MKTKPNPELGPVPKCLLPLGKPVTPDNSKTDKEKLALIKDYCDMGVSLFIHSNRFAHLCKLVGSRGGPEFEALWRKREKRLKGSGTP